MKIKSNPDLQFHPDPRLPKNYAVLGPDAEGKFVFGRTNIAAPLETFRGSYLQLVKMLRARREKEKLKKEPFIREVYLFPNGMAVVLDQFGNQMPRYQGRTEEVLPLILADKTPETEFHK